MIRRELDSQEETFTHLSSSIQNYGKNQILLDIRKNLVDYLKLFCFFFVVKRIVLDKKKTNVDIRP